MSSVLMHPVCLPGVGVFVADLTHDTTMLDMLCLNMVYHVRSLLAHMVTLCALETHLNLVKHGFDCIVKLFKWIDSK